MSQNIIDSILFIASARKVLADSIVTDDVTQTKNLKKYIINEMTDYEVISTVFYNTVPDKKYDIIDESLMFYDIKQAIRKNKDLIKIIGEDTVNNIDTILPYGISTQAPIMEHFSTHKTDLRENAIKFWEKQTILSEAAQPQEQPTQSQKMVEPTGGAAILTTLKPFIPMATIIAITRLKGGAAQAATHAVPGAGTTSSLAASRHLPDPTQLSAYVASTNQGIAKAEKVAATATGPDKEKAEGIAHFLSTQKDKFLELLSKAREGVAGAATGAVGTLKSIGSTTGAGALATKYLGLQGGTAAAVGGGSVVLGGLALAALLSWAAIKTYRRFFSQAAKACRGKSSGEKTACMKAYQIKALQAKVVDLKKGESACSKSKDPQKCISTINKNIAKSQEQIRKLGGK